MKCVKFITQMKCVTWKTLRLFHKMACIVGRALSSQYCDIEQEELVGDNVAGPSILSFLFRGNRTSSYLLIC